MFFRCKAVVVRRKKDNAHRSCTVDVNVVRFHFLISKKLSINLNRRCSSWRWGPCLTFSKQGVIQAYEFTHTLAWNVLKDFFQVMHLIFGSKDATREAFSKELMEQGSGWMDRIGSRNKSSHTYKWIFLWWILSKTQVCSTTSTALGSCFIKGKNRVEWLGYGSFLVVSWPNYSNQIDFIWTTNKEILYLQQLSTSRMDLHLGLNC